MKSKFRIRCFAIAVMAGVLLSWGCEHDDTTSGDLQLYYSSVMDIGPSMTYQSNVPTWYGPTPSDFAISGITFDDTAVESGCFSINSTTGSVTIVGTDDLEAGVYKLSISCLAGGRTYNFKDIFVVQTVPATPETLELSDSVLEIPYAELDTTEASVTVTPASESVTIISYGLVQAEGQEYFAISSEGVITLNSSFTGEFLPGNYPLPIQVTTYAGTAVYENLLTARITSEPLSVNYSSTSGRMETNLAFQSPTPTMKGSPDEVVWAIKEVHANEQSAETDLIKIDSGTGVISVDEGNGLNIGDSYTIDVTVTNSFGSADFEGVYTITVIDYIEPIDADSFRYADTEVVEGLTFTAALADGFIGDEVSFSLGELPEELSGVITINEVSGQISSTSGLFVSPGEYTIPVTATNAKGSAETTLKLTVVENPNMFSVFSYGNNLGLDWESNADQFEYDYNGGSDVEADIPLLHSDIPEGQDVTFTKEFIHNPSTMIRSSASKTYLNSDGSLHITLNGAQAGGISIMKITATVGTGATAISRSTYLFVHFKSSSDKIFYSPFVFRVNPRTGGYSAAPTYASDVDPSKLYMTARRTFNYFNIDGPSTHTTGALSSDNTAAFIYRMWATYPWSGGAVNAGSREPMSYYATSGTEASVVSDLSIRLGYIDGANENRMYIPANKWMLDGAYANGILHFQTTFVTNGDFSKLNDGTQMWMVVWFDENF